MALLFFGRCGFWSCWSKRGRSAIFPEVALIDLLVPNGSRAAVPGLAKLISSRPSYFLLARNLAWSALSPGTCRFREFSTFPELVLVGEIRLSTTPPFKLNSTKLYLEKRTFLEGLKHHLSLPWRGKTSTSFGTSQMPFVFESPEADRLRRSMSDNL